MNKLQIDKEVMATLSRIGSKAKSDCLDDALLGILFAEKDKRPKGVFKRGKAVIVGCAFPKISAGKGCEASGQVDAREMGKTIAQIYKHGYVPMGLVVISSLDSEIGDEEDKYPYGSTTDDRRASFKFLWNSSSDFAPPFALMVVDDDNKPYWNWRRKLFSSMRFGRKVTEDNLKATKGGAVWISRDSWVSSTLGSMGIKVLR